MPSGLRVSITTNADEYAATLRVRATALTKSCQQTGDEIGAIVLERAKWWSEGPYKQKELNRLGHPYAKRHHEMADVTPKRSRSYQRVSKYAKGMRIGEGYPARINTQTGDFLAGWHWEHTRKVGTGDMVGSLSNTSQHAQYLTRYGTEYMIPRPVMQAIMRESRKRSQHLYGQIFPRMMRAAGPVSGSNLRAAFSRGFQRGMGLATFVGGI